MRTSRRGKGLSVDADLGYLDRALRARLTAEMGARGWTLKDVAAASGIPVSRLKRYMDGDRSFRLQDVDRLAGMFGLPIRELLGFD